jgi:hypothetical protein
MCEKAKNISSIFCLKKKTLNLSTFVSIKELCFTYIRKTANEAGVVEYQASVEKFKAKLSSKKKTSPDASDLKL